MRRLFAQAIGGPGEWARPNTRSFSRSIASESAGVSGSSRTEMSTIGAINVSAGKGFVGFIMASASGEGASRPGSRRRILRRRIIAAPLGFDPRPISAMISN